jgi:peptidoglycan hydrolase-like protein with peptidoglycan-binding domain
MNFSKYAVAVLLLAVAGTPLYVQAQTATTTSRYRTYNTYDGSTEASSTRQQRIRGYRQQTTETQQKIAALGTASSTAVFMPILFGVALTDIFPNFGDPRDGGARTHEGEDIMGVKGTPIVSPTAAVVLRVLTGASEGNTVYTANPGGEVFVYMHLDRFGEGVTQGTVLQQGSLVGYAGDTGNALGGPAHLHFEIHDANNQPINPFPRLSVEFTVAQKMSYLTTILSQSASSTGFAVFLVTNFRNTFTAALATGVALPQSIIDALASVPAPTIVAGRMLPSGELDVGSTGAAVVALQNYLIQAARGPAAVRLATAGATGTFGAMTKAALVEFQQSVGITPASGYYGPLTRSYVESHALASLPTTPTPVVSATSTTAALTKDLQKGITDPQVRTLQKMLNAKGFMVAASGDGSAGFETEYFGSATLAAVIAFQTARGIAPAVGFVGPLTRAALLAL